MRNGTNSTSTDTTYLYMNRAIVARLPTKCSRHNTTSRSHAITKVVKNTCFSSSTFENVENVAEKSENVLVGFIKFHYAIKQGSRKEGREFKFESC